MQPNAPVPPSTPDPLGRNRADSFNLSRSASLPSSKTPRRYSVPASARVAKTGRRGHFFIPVVNMEDIVIPSETVPAELKAGCEQILKRAKELKKPEPIVAYWCKRRSSASYWRSKLMASHRLLLCSSDGAQDSESFSGRHQIPTDVARLSRAGERRLSHLALG